METKASQTRATLRLARLIALLEVACARFKEPVWQELLDTLLPRFDRQGNSESSDKSSAYQRGEKTVNPPDDEDLWFRQNHEQLSIESTVLRKLLLPLAAFPDFFFFDRKEGLLGAIGLIDIGGGVRLRIEVLYPRSYALVPCACNFFRGRHDNGVRSAAGLIPVPPLDVPWRPGDNAGTMISHAVDWLTQNADIYPISRWESISAGREVGECLVRATHANGPFSLRHAIGRFWPQN